jgi:hypothetical protein
LILTAGLIAIWFSPFIVSKGSVCGSRGKPGSEGLVVSLDQVDAPFLRPVLIRGCRLSGPDHAFHFEFTVKQASLDLNFKHILLGMRGPRDSRFFDSRITWRTAPQQSSRAKDDPAGLATLQQLLPRNSALPA